MLTDAAHRDITMTFYKNATNYAENVSENVSEMLRNVQSECYSFTAAQALPLSLSLAEHCC